MAGIRPPEVTSSVPAAALSAPATTAPAAAKLRAIPAHFVAHPLAIFLWHPLPPFVARSLAVILRHPLPLLAHFLAHLAPLVRRNLRVCGPGDSRQGRHYEQNARDHPPDEHLQHLSSCTPQLSHHIAAPSSGSMPPL